ncbi:MAG: heavy-metal-associated domain-containing protein [Deltaproteobacteria bacterium]|nr:heavy-metal-associated domain-containing protein [Deltaproteobacteria bacterium]
MKGYLLLAVSLGLLLHAAPTNAAFVSAELRVNGLSCPFCAFGIEKKLLDVDGVTDVGVFLDDGRLTLTFELENAATVSDLEKAVEKAGFKLAALQLTVRGHLVTDEEGGPRLVASARMRFRLVERRGETTEPISTNTLMRLRESTGQGAGSMLVSGDVGDRDEEEPTLIVKSAETPRR